jgi:hypothetical protein
MNEMLVYTVCVSSAIACVVAFGLYHIYRGIQASLSTANVGEVYNFEYLQPKSGVPERVMVKVVGVSVLTKDQISRLNATSNYRRYDPVFERTNHLVTGQSPDGTIRNFYAERVVNCRRPLLGGTLFKTGIAAMLF